MSDEHANDVTVHGYAKIVRAGLGSWSDEWIAEHAPTGRYAAKVQKQRAALDALESQNQALQERAEKAEAVVDVMHRTYHTGVSECPCVQLLSPTQETDPRCPTCNSGDRHFAANSTSTTDPPCSNPWHDRPTQETDPE